MPKEFFIDEDSARFVRSFTDTSAESPGNLFRGDIRDARLYFLRQTGVFGRPYRTVDRSGVDSLSFAIGDISSEPTGGTFTLTFDGDTTAAIAYNATAAQVETAINGSWDGTAAVTVEKIGNTLFVITFDDVGVRTAITGSAALLTPLSGLFINVRTTGTASVREVVTVELAVAPAALATSWSGINTTVTATVEELIAGDATSNEVQRILFSQRPALGTFAIRIPEYTRAATAAVVGGVFVTTTNHGASVGQPVIFSSYDTPVNLVNGQRYFVAEIVSATAFRVSLAQFGTAITNATADASTATVTFPGGQTDRIDYDADGQEIGEAFELLEQIGVGNASVTRLSDTEIAIAFRGQKSFAVIPLLEVENFLEGLAGLSGSLNLSTERIRELLAVSLSVELTAEVQILDDGNVETVAQSSAIISRDLIVGSSIAPQLGFSIVPITAGGTGETSAAAAVTALGLPAAANIATLSGTQTFTGSKAFVGNTFPIGTFERETGAATTGIFGATGLRASSTGVLADGFGPLFVAQIKGSGMGSFSGIGQIGFVRAGADNTGDIIFQPLAAGVATTRLLVRATGNVWLRNSLEFEGSTLDANKTTLTVTDPTASNTITLPNASGTVGLVLSGTATIDFASVNSGNWSTTETITVTGAATGDSVSLGLPTAAGTEDIIFTAWVSAADTVSIKFHNANGGSVNLASLAYKATIIR